MKILKNRFISATVKACALTSVALLVFSSLFSCSGNEAPPVSSDADRIAALESQISSLQANSFLMESEYLESIASLESQIASLKGQAGATPPASSAIDTPSNPEYFGFEYITENGEVTITAYNGKSSEIIIPASINGSPVVHIADNAFENSSLVSVSMPETLESIGWFAFSGSIGLERVVIPKNVSEIGYSAFSGIKNLVIYAPNGSYAYQYAKSYGIRVSEE